MNSETSRIISLRFRVFPNQLHRPSLNSFLRVGIIYDSTTRTAIKLAVKLQNYLTSHVLRGNYFPDGFPRDELAPPIILLCSARLLAI